MGLLRSLLFIAVIMVAVRLALALTGRGAARNRRKPRRLGRKSPHAVLGVPPGAPHEEIRRAYQQRMREYHPDRVAGLAPEIRELAERRSKEINQAYDALRGT